MGGMKIEIREIACGDPDRLARAFPGDPRGPSHFEGLLRQHRAGARIVLVGVVDSSAAGHGSLVWQPTYHIPDGHGVFQAGRFPEESEQVALDDELVLHLVKAL